MPYFKISKIKNKCNRRKNGFALIELIFVLSIISILIGLILCAVQNAKNSSDKLNCSNQLRQLGLGLHSYHASNQSFPPALKFDGFSKKKSRMLYYTWPVLLLPYIEQEPLWKLTVSAYQTQEWVHKNPPHVGLTTVVKTYTCPSDGRLVSPITDSKGYSAAYGSYWGVNVANKNDLPVWGFEKGIRISEILDGTCNTLMIGESPPAGRLLSGNWYTIGVTPRMEMDPDFVGPGICTMGVISSGNGKCRGPIVYGPGRLDNPCDFSHFWSFHSGGANFLFADGGVRYLPYSAKGIMPALASRSGGEVVSLP